MELKDEGNDKNYLPLNLKCIQQLLKPTNALLYIVFIVKFALKHLKSADMFRSIDHHQGAHVVPC
jgi:hypothetical protein